SQGSAQGLDINSQGSAQEESTSFDAFGRARAWISDRTTPASGGRGDNDGMFNEKLFKNMAIVWNHKLARAKTTTVD
ncbi:unnamed protein product, partial [Ectocarpus sp. 12 AP-2014]